MNDDKINGTAWNAAHGGENRELPFIYPDWEEKKAHWLDFSTRLVDTYTGTVKRKEKLKEEIESFIDFRDPPDIHGWDVWVTFADNPDHTQIMSDLVDNVFDEYAPDSYTENGMKPGKFLHLLILALRTGLDVAIPAECSSGTGPFSVKDLRSMYPDGFPGWVKAFFTSTEGADENFKPFNIDELADDELIVL